MGYGKLVLIGFGESIVIGIVEGVEGRLNNLILLLQYRFSTHWKNQYSLVSRAVHLSPL